MGEFSGTLRQQVLDWLAENVPESRLKHVLSVEQMSINLARQHHLDTNKAAQAGLMHDLAKYFKPKQLLDIARSEGLPLDAVYEANPHLLHADVGAIVARDQFGINDPEVLAAIANHTLGRPDMSPLSCVVFLADSLEPNRGYTLELIHLRQVSQTNLDRAVWLTCDYTIQHLIKKRRLIHPRVLLTRNWFLQRSTQTKSPSEQPAKTSPL
jgi:predicted HD superfamily hydrolase involved in NAD metabolism